MHKSSVECAPSLLFLILQFFFFISNYFLLFSKLQKHVFEKKKQYFFVRLILLSSFQIWSRSLRGIGRRAVRHGHDRRRRRDVVKPDQIAGRAGLSVREEMQFERIRFRIVRTRPRQVGGARPPPVQVQKEIRRGNVAVRMTLTTGRVQPTTGSIRHV